MGLRDGDDELLVDPDFLQSSSKPARKCTRYFLNPTLPFSSLASGMTMLTSIRTEGAQPTKVVVSATKDPLGEVGIIELPEGAAYTSLGGFLIAQHHGRVPPPGTTLAFERHEFTVREGDARRVLRVSIRPRPAPEQRTSARAAAE